MNKDSIAVLFLIFISLFASQKLFSDKFYTSHDGGGHVIRMEEFHKSISDGQFPVRLAQRINYGLSYPFFNFNYPFIYYVGELFHRGGMTFVVSFKTLMILSVIIGGVSVYFLSRLYFSILPSVMSGIFNIIAPYKFLNMYVRGNVAESVGLALIPLLLLSIELFVRNKKHSFVFLTVCFSTLIVSHNISAVIGIVLGFSYFLFLIYKKSKKRALVTQFIKSFLISLCITAFFWLPVVVESPLTKLVDVKGDYNSFFPSVREIIYSPWGFGGYVVGEYPGKMSPQIGLIHEVSVVFVVIVFFVKFFKRFSLQDKDRLMIFFLCAIMVSIFLTLSISKFIWDTIPILQFVQIPWRFIGYTTLGVSILSAYLFDATRNKKARVFIAIIFISFLFYANRNHIRVNQYIEYESPFLVSELYGPSTTSKDEHMPRFAPRIFMPPSQKGTIIPSTSGKSERVAWKSNYHAFTVDLIEEAQFRDNTSYFPGWVATIDGKKANLLFSQDEFYRLRLAVPGGKHIVEFFFTEVWYRAAANTVTILSLFLFGAYMIRKQKRTVY